MPKIPPSSRTQDAIDTPFDNSTNGFTADEVQSAIEEAKETAEGKPRFTLTLVNNGTISNNQWVAYSDLTPDLVILFPIDCTVKEFTWANKNTDVSFDLEFYKNGIADPGDKYRTVNVVNDADGHGYYSGWDDDFTAGDWIRIKYKDQGTNCKDLVCVIFAVAS